MMSLDDKFGSASKAGVAKNEIGRARKNIVETENYVEIEDEHGDYKVRRIKDEDFLCEKPTA